jgi:hypothetical protein
MGREAAFTLIEIMVVMAMLTVIIVGLMAMFDQTQKAFRAGMAQVDQLEGGRMVNDLIVRDLLQMRPSDETNGVNFFAEIPAQYTPLALPLPGSSIPRMNILYDLYFTTRDNQYWNGIGYFVRTNSSYFGNANQVGTLYRYEASTHTVDFIGNAYQPYLNFLNATNPQNFSKIIDGVVEFKVQCYDTNGRLITNGSPSVATNNFIDITNSLVIAPGQVEFYAFSNNIVPAYVDIELGILEPAVLKRYRAIPNPIAQASYLTNHAASIQVFRQRVPIRNVDPSAYSPQP